MTDYSHETRAIYHEQHSRVANDERAMTRFINMFSEEYFGLPVGWFNGKIAIDCGCGSTAKVLIALYRLGAKSIHGFDLDTDFILTAQASLRRHGVLEEAVHIKSASVLNIPHDDNSFDFVCCHGVLLHLNNLDETRRGFAELARITRRGGYLYTVFGLSGGLLEDAIYPAVREYYRSNENFKRFVDAVSPSDLHEFLDKIESGMKKYADSPVDLSDFKSMLDTDFCVTIQNIVQAPVRLDVPESMIREMYASQFGDLRRLRRYVRRENVRKYFAPLHYITPDDANVQMFYGSGNLEFIGQKI